VRELERHISRSLSIQSQYPWKDLASWIKSFKSVGLTKNESAATSLIDVEKNRLEAFSDGVLAIIITIMVLELKVPHGSDWAALEPLLPVFLSYVLSFLYVGIYWNNHHHLLKACRRVNGGILWANLHLLFWLSLFPFVTGWMGENHFTSLPSALYGAVLLLAAIAYYILQTLIVAEQGGSHSKLARAIGKDWKGKLSPMLYLLGTVVSFFSPKVAGGIYVFVALMWLIPDPRLARVVHESESPKP
jgi:uncharacterized membrane protein